MRLSLSRFYENYSRWAFFKWTIPNFMKIRQSVWTLVLVHSQMDGHDVLELHAERLNSCWINWLQSASQRHLLWLNIMDKRNCKRILNMSVLRADCCWLTTKIISFKLQYSITLSACPVYLSVRWSLLVDECSQGVYTVMWRPLLPCFF